MKNIIERIGHLPTTALGLLLITIATLHFTGIVTVQELGDFAHGLDALLVLLGIGGIAAKSWPQFRAESEQPSEDEPNDENPPATPFPNPTTPRPPKK